MLHLPDLTYDANCSKVVQQLLINFTCNNTNFAFNNTNFTSNNTVVKIPQEQIDVTYDYFDIILLVLLSLILIIGSVGNAVVCYVFGFKQHKRRSVPELLFLYLGAIDLMSSMVNPSMFIYWTITKYKRWDFGIIGCKLLPPLATISVTLSALIIMIIAVDRYWIIFYQLGRTYSRKKIHCAVVFAAAYSLCIYIPYIALLEVKKGSTCLVHDISEKSFAYTTISGLLLQDTGFICVLAFTNAKTLGKLNRECSVQMEQSLQARRLRSHKRVSRILLAMSCVFCILVLPRDIMQLIYIISWNAYPVGISFTPTLIRMNTLFKVLQTANSCVNVFIYSRMHRKFRSHLLSLLYRLIGKKELLIRSGTTFVSNNTEFTPKSRRRGWSDASDTSVCSPMVLKNIIEHPNKKIINFRGDTEGMNPLLKNKFGDMKIRLGIVESSTDISDNKCLFQNKDSV